MAEEIREFYEYVSTGKTGGELTRRIDQAVDNGHRNEIWRSEYIKEIQILIDAKEEGREEGIEEEKENTERERKRADDAEQRAEKAEAENAAYKAEIEKYREEIEKYRAAGVTV